MKNHLLMAIEIKAEDINAPAINAGFNELSSIVNTIYFIAAAVAVLIIIISGIRYVISAGDPKQLTSAKNGILYSLVGLVVVSIAFAITNFIIGATQ